MKRIAALALSAAIAGSTLMVGQTNVSFWMDLGGAGVSVNHHSGRHVPPPPPPRRVVHYVDYGWDGHDYGDHHHSKKLKKRYKQYRKAQKKFYKELYKHHRHHSRHHWDDDDD